MPAPADSWTYQHSYELSSHHLLSAPGGGYPAFNAQSAPYSYTTVLNGHDGQMFAPRHSYDYGEGSPPLGVRDYPMMAGHSPQLEGHDEKIEYRTHEHEDKYAACALQEEPRYAPVGEEYEKAAMLHEKHYESERHGDLTQPVVVKMEPSPGQAYTTLPPFLN